MTALLAPVSNSRDVTVQIPQQNSSNDIEFNGSHAMSQSSEPRKGRRFYLIGALILTLFAGLSVLAACTDYSKEEVKESFPKRKIMWALAAICWIVLACRFLAIFRRKSRSAKRVVTLASSSSAQSVNESALICTAEVSIDGETVLTVRSWWPCTMSQDDVSRHGSRVAMSSARRWLDENSSSHNFFAPKLKFSSDDALALCHGAVIAAPISSNINLAESASVGVKPASTGSAMMTTLSLCPVCLDDLCECSSSGEDTKGVMPIVRMSSCGHCFHDACLASWFVQSGKLVCPVCRCDHSTCLTSDRLRAFTVKHEPKVDILTISVEEGALAAGRN